MAFCQNTRKRANVETYKNFRTYEKKSYTFNFDYCSNMLQQ